MNSFEHIYENIRKLNEYFEMSTLVNEFDSIYDRDLWVDQFPNDGAEMFDTLKPKIDQAHKNIASWVEQAKEEGIGRVHQLDIPCFWLESTDAWDMAGEGDWSAVTEFLDDIIHYGPALSAEVVADALALSTEEGEE